ncbi:MAG TPA: DUF2179 domain-containing protein [Flavobacteriaceae bacterium]|nr:DUF2179 domain-containing protein [Flavobacteriaceae bacterium]
MESFFLEYFGLTPEVLNYVVLPVLIFLARIGDVSISTVRIMFVMGGKKTIAPILGFFEALIWLLAIGQIFNNIDNAWSYFAYAAGFASGTFIGMHIEEKLAIGQVVLRLITKEPVHEFLNFLQENNYRYSILDAEGITGKVNVVFLVLKRDNLKPITQAVNLYHPNAFYTIEGVKQVNESNIDDNVPQGIGLWRGLTKLKRK